MIRARGLIAGVRPVLVVAVALAVSLTIFQLAGYQVGDVVQGAVDGAIGSPQALGESVRWAIPLLLMGLGVAVSFRGGLYNIGAQGQMYAGALVSLTVGLAGGGRQEWLFLPAAVLAGCAAGALWSLIPGVLRVCIGADEVVTTLMGNFIATLLVEWAVSGPLKSSAGSGQAATTQNVAGAYRLSGESGVSGVLVAVCCAVTAATWVLLNRTRMGLEINLAGRNAVMARWQGIGAVRMGLTVFAVSGATAGLAGAIEVFGPSGAVQADFSPDVGLMAVVVALVGGLGVWGVVAAAVFFGGLRAATLYLPVVSDLPTSALDLLNGLVALLITTSTVPPLLRRRARRAARPAEAGTPAGPAGAL